MCSSHTDSASRYTSVSVVITCYKQSAFIASAIESVLAQTLPASEIIVVDDGSPDETAAVVAGYPDVRYVYQHNQDVSTARNTGIKHASGKYIVFLDGDDRLLPHALEMGVKYLDANSSWAFVAGKHQDISEAGEPLPVIRRERNITKDHYRAFLQRNFIGCPAAVMHRRDALESVGGFDPALNPTGDWDLYLRVSHRFPINCYDEIIAEYRRHSGNTSLDLDLMMQNSLTVLRLQLELIKGDKKAEAACRKGLHFQEHGFRAAKIVAQLRVNARAGKWGQALRDAASLLFYDPIVFVEHAGRKMRNVLQD